MPLTETIFISLTYEHFDVDGFEITIDDVTYDPSDYYFYFIVTNIGIPLLSKNVTEIIFDATKSLRPFPFSFNLTTAYAPTDYGIVILTEEKPIYKIDLLSLPKNSFFTVELDAKETLNNEKLEIFYANLFEYESICFLIYNNDTKKFTHTLDMFLTYNFNYTNGTLKYVTIYKPENCLHFVSNMPTIFRAKYASTKNCVFSNNIFAHSNVPTTLTAISKSTGYCEIHLVARSLISQIYTNSKTQMLTMQSETNEKQKIFEFNKNDAQQWKNLHLSGSFYSIKIPPSANLALFFTSLNPPTIQINSHPFKSFIDTPCCRKLLSLQNGTFFAIYEISNFAVIFRVEVFDLSSEAAFFATDSSGKTLNFKNITTEIIYENTVVKLWYYEPDMSRRGARIVIETVSQNLV